MAGVAPDVTAIPLGRVSPRGSCDQPGRGGDNAPCPFQTSLERTSRPYSVLLPVGFALPRPLLAARCALTAPFHPYPRRIRGGSISVALSLGSPPPDVIRHRRCVEPGLSSDAALTARQRPSGRLVHLNERSRRPLSSPRLRGVGYNRYKCPKVFKKFPRAITAFVQQQSEFDATGPSARGPVRQNFTPLAHIGP